MDTDPALSQAQTCDTVNPAPDESSFSFTPIKALKALPRLWERKPSTPFKGGIKSKKLWKRFQTSFSNMQSLESSTALDNNAWQTAVNASGDASHARGVKRLRIESDELEDRTRPQSHRPENSFLETKWESEISWKRRKMPDALFNVYDENLQNKRTGPISEGDIHIHHDLGAEGDLSMTASPVLLKKLRSPSRTPVFHDGLHAASLDSPAADAKTMENQYSRLADTTIDNVTQDSNSNGAMATPSKVVRSLTQAQEGTLVRSALRSSLDGEDAELLSDFLSKAKAKRAAKAALITSQDTDGAEKSSGSEESPDTECLTPRSRRALEDLDANSPSPIKIQVSPSKGDGIPNDDSCDGIITKLTAEDVEEPAPASPVCRRSSRVKAPAPNAPPARNMISLRRAKGTEFVFLQRTEAQELALVTKRNTKHNRGDAMMPKYTLQAIAQQQHNESAAADSKVSRTHRSRKQVSWNEERLVEYEDDILLSSDDAATAEQGESSTHDVGEGSSRSCPESKRPEKKTASSTRSSRSLAQQKTNRDTASSELEGGPTAPMLAPASATPRSRRVRRLADSTMISGTPVKTGSGRISKPPAASAPAVAVSAAAPLTPTKARRKLIPKSPSASLLPAPAAKVNGTSDQSFVSGIPTRSGANSENTKRKSMLEASAGCTPMPRRVRART
ncbi:hypothetical protein N7462_007730 [Penicillium macrosclerotiorum]|uniref:uncharacterized protein n=1 Tax=Penicillium macrosclerotiorum TaxID=303699 RepID=UPI00254974B2|nr:uncharacterized protein N7462_007730 [Penicillium macrosclerotiorum]KAJ5679486.1 hypothetical protein N7462_007730 [Penicillium macrosclerotiorum]